MKYFLCIVVACSAFLFGNADQSDKVLVDLLVGKQLANLNQVIKTNKLTTLILGDYTLPGNKVIARGVKLGDLSTLKATDHAYMWTSPGNSIEAQVFLGLSNMTVEIDSLTFNGQTFPATFTVGINSLGFHQKMTLQENKCQETYSDIAFYKLDDVKIYTTDPTYNGQDVSQFVQMEVLPFANNLMQQKLFQEWVEEYFNLCNN